MKPLHHALAIAPTTERNYMLLMLFRQFLICCGETLELGCEGASGNYKHSSVNWFTTGRSTV